MSSLLFPTVTSLLLLSLLPFSTAFLTDVDGDPIFNGRNYYIVPINTSLGGGLTFVEKNNDCPLFITPDKKNSHGTPVQISSPLRILILSLEMPVSLAFKPTSDTTLCKNSLVWQQTLDAWARKLYITAGGGGGPLSTPFTITKRDKSLLPTYELRYCPYGGVCSNVGLHKDDGLLGITEYSTTVSFKKAFDVLELSTSAE